MSSGTFMELTLDVWKFRPESATRVGHPAPFPVELPRRFAELYTYRNDVVLDPFMGSGSTALAAIQTGRRFIGFDTDRAYVAAAEARIRSEAGQGAEVRVATAIGWGGDPAPEAPKAAT